jgi:hypothetical protein
MANDDVQRQISDLQKQTSDLQEKVGKIIGTTNAESESAKEFRRSAEQHWSSIQAKLESGFKEFTTVLNKHAEDAAAAMSQHAEEDRRNFAAIQSRFDHESGVRDERDRHSAVSTQQRKDEYDERIRRIRKAGVLVAIVGVVVSLVFGGMSKIIAALMP